MKLSEDRVFETTGEKEDLACIMRGASARAMIEMGYEQAARLIYNACIDNNAPKDCLVYPLIFCLRHAMELRLKEILRHLDLQQNRKVTHWRHHDLLQMWDKCRHELKRLGRLDNKSETTLVSEVIRELKRIDPDSTVFRYEHDTRGKPYLESWHNLNLRSFMDRTGQAMQVLNGIAAMVSEYP